ncbi:MAG: response regulator [Blastocatellia bacterium]|nr:response regulator [Blastocatellia bacterium]
MTSILVVEDDLQFRTALVRDLNVQGYQVSVAQSVEEAVHLLAGPAPDILLTDLRMGERDGIDLLEQLCRLAPNTRAILMSAFATAKDHQRATELGAVRVLCKPFSSAELTQALEQAIDCGTGFRGSIHGLSLIDMLQMFHFGRRSITLVIGGAAPGSIHFQGGEVIHAQCGPKQGEEALQILLNTPSGSVQTSTFQPVPQTIHRPFDSLLLDVLRVIDEEGTWDSDEFSAQPVQTNGNSAGPGPVPPATGTNLNEFISEKWKLVCQAIGKTTENMLVVAFTTNHPEPLIIQGEIPSESLRESLFGLLEPIAALCPDSPIGVVEYVSGNLGLGMLWEVNQGFIILLSENTPTPSATVWFRQHLATMARIFLPSNGNSTS